MELEARPELNRILHVHISEENRNWLDDMKEKLNRPLNDLVNELIDNVREKSDDKKR